MSNNDILITKYDSNNSDRYNARLTEDAPVNNRETVPRFDAQGKNNNLRDDLTRF